MSVNFKKRLKKSFFAILVAFIMLATVIIPSGNVLIARAVINTPNDINDLGYLGRGVNLLRSIDKNDKSDDLLAQNHLKVILDDSNLSDFKVSKDPISSSYGQGFTSRSFASLAMSMGVDLSSKASASSDFVIGSAKMEAGFSMGINVSASTSVEFEYTIYNYQKYLDTWTLNWDNGGIKGSAATLRNHLQTSVYGALTDSLPQYTWSPQDLFDEYGTHVIVSYKRGGEYTFSSISETAKTQASLETTSTVEASGSAGVSSFGSAGFEQKVTDKETVDSTVEGEFRKTATYSRGSSKGQIDTSEASSVNSWGDGVDDQNAQVLSSGLTLIAIWDLLPAQYAARKAELQSYYNKKVAEKSDALLNKFVYKTVNDGDFDFSQYDAVISTVGDLDQVRNKLDGKYILACDIDLGQISNWQPIGTARGNDFTGVFDGNGNAIYNLNITSCNEPYIGLFGYNSGTIKNLSVNGNIALDNYDSSLLGEQRKPSIGGIAGFNTGFIENCQSNVTVNSTIEFTNSEKIESVDSTSNYPNADISKIFADAQRVSPTSASGISDEYNESVILDLKNCSTSINKTITLKAGAVGIYIIGDANKTYSGLHLNVQNSNFDRYIVLENVNWIYDSPNGAIYSNANTTLWIVSHAQSGASQSGNSIFTNTVGIPKAINVDNELIICGNADLSIVGSQGTKGGNGTQGDKGAGGSKSDGKNGYDGTAGLVGQVGGTAVKAGGCQVNLNATLTITGGTGGVGGTGGTGGTGGKGAHGRVGFPVHYDGWNGGTGGTGGTGGAGGTGGQALNTDRLYVYNGKIVLNGGAGGAGGIGGTGGTGGDGGDRQAPGSTGKKGVGGTGGVGGIGGLFGSSLAAIEETVTDIKIYQNARLILSDKGVGDSGAGGTGGTGRSSGASGSKGSIKTVSNKQSRVTYYTSSTKYSMYDADVTYSDALGIAKEFGGMVDLAGIHGESEQLIIDEIFDYHKVDGNKIFWIGAKRVASNIDKWAWRDGGVLEYDYIDKIYKEGSLPVYTNWDSMQPTSITNEDYLAVKSSGRWSAHFSSEKGGFITKESLDSHLDGNAFDLYVGGVVGENRNVVTYCRNDADITISVKAKADFSGVFSGIVGGNSGRVEQVFNKGKINVNVIPTTTQGLNANLVIRKITQNIAPTIDEGGTCVLAGYHSTGAAGLFNNGEQGGYHGASPNSQWETDSKVELTSDGYNQDDWENTLWQAERVRIAGVDRTKFLQNEVLANNVVTLSYVDSYGKVNTSKTYSYKYDFSSIGVTAIKLSYNYKDDEHVQYIPVLVTDIIVKSVEIDLENTKLSYEYGDEFELPIIKKTMSDGMVYCQEASLGEVRNIPEMTDYGTHKISVLCKDENVTLYYDVKIEQKVVEATAEQLKIKNRTAVAGEQVVVEFCFANMPQFKSVLLYSFIYDEDRLEILEGNWKVEGEIADWDAKQKMATFTYGENKDSNIIMFELVLKVKDNCPVGDYTISCSAIVNSENENGYDNALSLEVAPGNVNVIDVPRGDFNGDNVVDEEDAILLLRYTLFGSEVFSLNQSGDLNGDDIVNSDDAIHLLRHYMFPNEYPLYW